MGEYLRVSVEYRYLIRVRLRFGVPVLHNTLTYLLLIMVEIGTHHFSYLLLFWLQSFWLSALLYIFFFITKLPALLYFISLFRNVV